MTRYSNMDKYIDSQVKFWQQQKEKIDRTEKQNALPFITISREYGSGGYEIAEKIVEILNSSNNPVPQWAAYNKKILENIMDDLGLSSSLVETMTNSARNEMTNLIQTSFSSFPPQVAVYHKLVETVSLLAANGHVVIIGRAGNVITRNLEHGFHVRITAAMDYKSERISKFLKVTKREAEKIIAQKTEERDSFLKKFIRFDVHDPHMYHLLINNSFYSTEEAASLIIKGLEVKGFL